MNQRVTMEVEMELRSDAIFGSGYSVPAGEDIGVCRDAGGYPYLRGSTLKGLLRQSLTDLLAWTGGTRTPWTEFLAERAGLAARRTGRSSSPI